MGRLGLCRIWKIQHVQYKSNTVLRAKTYIYMIMYIYTINIYAYLDLLIHLYTFTVYLLLSRGKPPTWPGPRVNAWRWENHTEGDWKALMEDSLPKSMPEGYYAGRNRVERPFSIVVWLVLHLAFDWCVDFFLVWAILMFTSIMIRTYIHLLLTFV